MVSMTTDRQSAEATPDHTPAETARETAARTDELTEHVGPKPEPRQAAVIYNPVKVDLDQLKAAVAAAEQAGAYEPSLWLETSEDDPGVTMAQEAVARGVSVVLAAGGDGTVRAVAEGVRGADVALALLPQGTGNLLARNLELTLDNLEESVSTAFAGADRPIDLGVARYVLADGGSVEKVFVVMAGLGLDAQMIVNTDEDLKKKAGWLAYVQALGKSIKGGRRIRLRYTLDDHQPRVSRVHTLLVGNCGSLPGNVLLLPEAAVDDGIFDIVALRPDGLMGWLSIWSKILLENGILRRTEVGRKLTGGESGTDRIRALRYLRGQQLRVQVHEPEEFELDGDTVGEIREFTVSVEPGALRIRVPG